MVALVKSAADKLTEDELVATGIFWLNQAADQLDHMKDRVTCDDDATPAEAFGDGFRTAVRLLRRLATDSTLKPEPVPS